MGRSLSTIQRFLETPGPRSPTGAPENSATSPIFPNLPHRWNPVLGLPEKHGVRIRVDPSDAQAGLWQDSSEPVRGDNGGLMATLFTMRRDRSNEKAEVGLRILVICTKCGEPIGYRELCA